MLRRIPAALRRIPAAVGRIPPALGRIPRAAGICALIAFLNAASWSVITPPFQVPDEPSHFAYVQRLAETASLPTSDTGYWSPEEQAALEGVRQWEVHFNPQIHTIASRPEQQRLERYLALPLARVGQGGAGLARDEPPLYYALQTVPYALGSSGSVLDRLELMRLLSALMAALTALFAYLFVREALPRAPWAWTVGGLGVALAPLLGFMSGGVNPDAMLFAVSAAIFYLLARAFRRGLTPRLAMAIGIVIAVGLFTKLNFVGLLPGVVVGLVLLSVREARSRGRSAYRSLALALTIGVSPICLYFLINAVSHHHGGLSALSSRANLGEIEYIWQFYLPRLPGMAHDFPGISPTRQIWFDRSVGLYGWLDTSFPGWVYNIALIPATLLALLGIRALVSLRAALRGRLAELAVYAAMSAGLIIIVAAASYRPVEGLVNHTTAYWQPRYLLPLLPLGAAALVLSARGAGRRWGPVVGALIVVLFLAHNVFSQLQVIARYYG